ncbi:hypothetical protein [Ekhidna sp.]|uniref:hypothetical protein n=1 Tax=Ekhidna sp. TaxID=2608089 RepID=UPI003C79B8C4
MRRLFFVFFFTVALFTQAQDEDIVAIIDDLTVKWDKRAGELGKYTGLKYYCTSDKYRNETIELLDKIHHYDTVLYQVVTEKYKDSKDKEAQATIDDILTVETEYTTPNFKTFLSEECAKYEEAGEEYGTQSGSKFYKEVEKIEKELNKYISKITERIDLIDEHVHHLKLD